MQKFDLSPLDEVSARWIGLTAGVAPLNQHDFYNTNLAPTRWPILPGLRCVGLAKCDFEAAGLLRLQVIRATWTHLPKASDLVRNKKDANGFHCYNY